MTITYAHKNFKVHNVSEPVKTFINIRLVKICFFLNVTFLVKIQRYVKVENMASTSNKAKKKKENPDENDEAEKVEDFHGVYLLVSQNPKYKGRTYVGFTVDPERRLKQHNGGREAGGACRTSNRGPWAMIMIVHGFPNMISALRFEWAWQHPKRSRRLNQVPPKKAREKLVEYHVRLLSEMLNTGPWCRLPLSIRWLRPDLKGDLDFPRDKQPPIHMPILYGQVKSVKLKKKKKKENPDENEAWFFNFHFYSS